MPDPLSIVGGVLGLLSITYKVTTELRKFHDGIVVINSTIQDLEHDVNGLAAVLESMRETFVSITAEHGAGNVASHWRNIAQSIEDGNVILHQLDAQVQEISKTSRFLDGPRKQLRLNLAENKLATFRVHIQSFRDGLQLSLQTVILWNQYSQWKSNDQILPSLSNLQEDVRRIALEMNLRIEALQSTVTSQQDQDQVVAMENLRETVRSAASIVSSASTTIGAPEDGESATFVASSDFGDCFPIQNAPAIQRWMHARTVSEYDEPVTTGPPESAADVLEIDASGAGDDSSDSDDDLEHEITDMLLENGKSKRASGDSKTAERMFRNCLTRLSTMRDSKRSSKTVIKHLEVIHQLFSLYYEQQKWAEAQKMHTHRMAIKARLIAKDDAEFLEDVLGLARLLQHRGELAEAELHARRALKGYRKLQKHDEVNICLLLLIDLCQADEREDDQEAYTMLMAIEERQSLSTTTSPQPGSQLDDPVTRSDSYSGNSVSILQESAETMIEEGRSDVDVGAGDTYGHRAPRFQASSQTLHYEPEPVKQSHPSISNPSSPSSALVDESGAVQDTMDATLARHSMEAGPHESVESIITPSPLEAMRLEDLGPENSEGAEVETESLDISQDDLTDTTSQTSIDMSREESRPPAPQIPEGLPSHDETPDQSADLYANTSHRTSQETVENYADCIDQQSLSDTDLERQPASSPASTRTSEGLPDHQMAIDQDAGLSEPARIEHDSCNYWLEGIGFISKEATTSEIASALNEGLLKSSDGFREYYGLHASTAVEEKFSDGYHEYYGTDAKAPSLIEVLEKLGPHLYSPSLAPRPSQRTERRWPTDTFKEAVLSSKPVWNLPPSLMSPTSRDALRNVVVVGDAGVGKTDFLKQCLSGMYALPLSGRAHAGQFRVSVRLGSLDVQLRLRETSLRANRKAYVDAHAVVICFDISRPQSLENVYDNWLSEVLNACPEVPILLVGCKRDLRYNWTTVIEQRQGEMMATRIGAHRYMECSADTSEGVDAIVEQLARLVSPPKMSKFRKLLRRS